MARPLEVIAAALFAASAPTALAQSPASNPSDWTRPYGQALGQETQPYQGGRGLNGNRVVINGVIQTGVGVSARAAAVGGVAGGAGLAGPFASAGASAIANQLNVVVQGNYNTVVVNSRQTNTGDVIAGAGAVAGRNTAEAEDEQR